MVVAFVLALGGYAVVNTGFFRVDRVEVLGATWVDPDEAARAAGVIGRDLYAVDTAAAARAVGRISGVRSARVQRAWPKRVIVALEERRPYALWQVGVVGHVVDRDGVVLDMPPDPSLPTVHQTDGAAGLGPGDRVDADSVALAARLRDTAAAAAGQRVARFEWTRAAGLDLVTDGGVRVRFGDGADAEYKLSVWRGLVDQARRERAAVGVIDLRFGDRAYYR